MQTEKPKGFKLGPLHILAIVVALAAIVAVAYLVIGNTASAQVVAVGDNVSVYYTGTLANGTVFGSNVGQQPLQFTVGTSPMIRGFEQAVLGMRLNQTKHVTIPASEAYGPVNQSLIMKVPRAEFGNMSLAVGVGVSTNSGQQAIIKALNSSTVTVDFNPPLAGQNLTFSIRIAAIQKG